MSRWRAAPPSMDWVQETLGEDTVNEGQRNYHHLSHFPSSLSLASYRLIASEDIVQSPAQLLGEERQRPRPTLPVELYRMIIQYLNSQHDLCTLARVSRAFQVEAERVLYHSVYLHHTIKTLWRCESLANQPRLALNVRKLSINVDQYSPFDSIARALNCCSRLRSLTLKGALWSDYSKVLDAVISTEIREFACNTRGEAGVLRFLERQPDLVEVEFEAHAFDFEDVSPNAIRNLHSFTGHLTTAAALVPGRPVRRLIVTSDMACDAMMRAVNRLSQGQGDLLALDLRTGVLREPIPWTILESIFTSLRELRFLGICSLDCARHPAFQSYLMGLPHLQTLVFGTGADDFSKYDEHVQRDLVYRLGHSCETLMQVIISLTMWRSDWIWTRNPGIIDPFCGVMGSRQEWWGTISRNPVNLEELAKLHCITKS